ncbi:hypothetical protein ACHAWF_003296 [Thalassiosira exigua]
MAPPTVIAGIVFLLELMSPVNAFVPLSEWGKRPPIAPSRRAQTSLVHQPSEREFSAPITWHGDAGSLMPWKIWNDAVAGKSVTMDHAPGTRIHLFNALLATSIPMIFSFQPRSFDMPFMSRAIFWGTFAGIAADNLIFAAGRYIGEGDVLRELTKARIIFHVSALPSLVVPVIEAVVRSRLLPVQHGNIAKFFALSIAFTDAMHWFFSYDINKLLLVDNRDSKTHTKRVMAGTLSYTSGPSKIHKMMVPIIFLNISLLIVGCKLWLRSMAAGPWFFIASMQSILFQSLQRPDIQAFSETATVVLMLTGLTSAH